MRNELTDAEWALLEPLLPQRQGQRGRPAKDHRLILNALLWLARTGAPWRDLPDYYGSWKTVYSRFRRWQLQGVWQQLLQELLRIAHNRGELDWQFHSLDSTIVRLHQHGAGARKRG